MTVDATNAKARSEVETKLDAYDAADPVAPTETGQDPRELFLFTRTEFGVTEKELVPHFAIPAREAQGWTAVKPAKSKGA